MASWWLIPQRGLHAQDKSHGQAECFPFTGQTPLYSVVMALSPEPPPMSYLLLGNHHLGTLHTVPAAFYQHKKAGKEGRYRQGVLNWSLLHFWGNRSSFIITVMFSILFLYPLGPSISRVHFSSTFYRWGNWGPPSWRQSWDHTRSPTTGFAFIPQSHSFIPQSHSCFSPMAPM